MNQAIDPQQLRSRIDIQQFLSGYVTLKKSGALYVGLCPFHDEKTPSFKVYSDHFHCYGCGAHGDIITFVMRYFAMRYRQALEWLAEQAGLSTKRTAIRPIAKPVNNYTLRRKRIEAERKRAEKAKSEIAYIIRNATVDVHPYLAHKGHPEAKVLISSAGWLIIPIWNKRGVIQSAQYISETGEKLFHTGAPVRGHFFRIGQSRYPRDIWLCEGYATALSIREALQRRSLHGISEVRACFSAHNLYVVGGEIVTGPRVYAVADNDKSGMGRSYAEKVGCPVWMPDEVGKDANDVHCESGLDDLAGELSAFRRQHLRKR